MVKRFIGLPTPEDENSDRMNWHQAIGVAVHEIIAGNEPSVKLDRKQRFYVDNAVDAWGKFVSEKLPSSFTMDNEIEVRKPSGTLVGVIDAIITTNGRRIAVEIKTGGEQHRRDFIQAALYTAYWNGLHPDRKVVGAIVVYLNKYNRTYRIGFVDLAVCMFMWANRNRIPKSEYNDSTDVSVVELPEIAGEHLF